MEVFGGFFVEGDRIQEEKENEQMREWDAIEANDEKKKIDQIKMKRMNFLRAFADCLTRNGLENINEAFFEFMDIHHSDEGESIFCIKKDGFQKVFDTYRFFYHSHEYLDSDQEYCPDDPQMFIDYIDWKTNPDSRYNNFIDHEQWREAFGNLMENNECAHEKGILRIKLKDYEHPKALP